LHLGAGTPLAQSALSPSDTETASGNSQRGATNRMVMLWMQCGAFAPF